MAGLGDFAKSGGSAVGGDRFPIVNVLPGATVAGFVYVLIATRAYDPDARVDLAAVIPRGGNSVVMALLGAFGLFVIGVLLRPFQVALVQLLEGHRWPAWSGFLHSLAVERHRRARHRAELAISSALSDEEARRTLADAVRSGRAGHAQRELEARMSRRADDYPSEDHLLMPTLLGNVLRQGEISSGARYGLDTMTVAHHIYPFVAEPLRAELSESLNVIDTTAALSLAFGVCALASAPLVLRGLDPWSLTPLVMALLAVLAYQGAVRAARQHGPILAACVGLARLEMIRALGWKDPESASEEVAFNKSFTKLLQRSHSIEADPYLGGRPYRQPDQAGDATGKGGE